MPCQVGTNDFQRNLPFKLKISCPVNGAHPAMTDHLDKPVAAELIAGLFGFTEIFAYARERLRDRQRDGGR